MKRFSILLFICTIYTISISAQEIASSFLDKFGKDDNLEVVTIGKKMLQMMEGIASKDPDFTEVIKGLENIQIISSTDSVLSNEYYDSAYEIMTKKKQGFEQLVEFKNSEETLIIMVKESRGAIRELVLLSNKKTQGFNLITLNGKIDMEPLVKYSERINIPGLKVLDSVNNDKNEQPN